jgi:hypothetical protein
MTTFYRCCDDLRREAVLSQNAVNAIDYLEVVDHDAPTEADRQKTLKIHFVKAGHPALTAANIRIDGGERIRPIHVTGFNFVGDVLVVTVDPRGDFSPYVFRLVELNGDPLASLDPQLAAVEFSFKVECASDFDCAPQVLCREPAAEPPRIDYLAKDYESFRRLMLDRMSLLVPSWSERNAADLGMALVETLAYVADHLSYEQDAVATEAYLATARRRTSVRRHARLVDYRMHDGCNARVFAQFDVAGNLVLPIHTQLFTKLDRFDVQITAAKFEEALNAGPTVFETLHAERLFKDHNLMHFYTWQSQRCCLPRGATSATLAGAHPNLRKGTLLIFEEILGPLTGNAADADPRHRCVVRLDKDAVVGQDPVTPGPLIPITEITWDPADALPFALCATAKIDGTDTEVSIVRGNVVVADHGRTIADEPLGAMPEPSIFRPPERGDACDRAEAVAVPVRFRPRLQKGPLTQQGRIALPTADDPDPAVFDPAAPAAAAMAWELPLVLPRIALHGTLDTDVTEWEVHADLFSSDETSLHFVADVEDDGIAAIRFGDDEYGAAPLIGTAFTATYRVGNGAAGNIGAGALAHAVTTLGVTKVRNPLPARGGIDPEPLDHARQAAPFAFRVQERAVTEADYAAVTQRHAGVSRAAATFRWTGSWYTVFDTIDRDGGAEVDDAYRREIRDFVERYRVVGNDLDVDKPRFVSLDVEMLVCVKPEIFRRDVEAEMLDIFSSGVRRDGTLGFFHPDSFTFGQTVYLSRLYAAAQGVPGVEAVAIRRFERQGDALTSGIDTGELRMARLEIARLENNRDFPERGRLTLEMRGGR